MESFHWDKHFLTGLSDVDQQHHHLVDIINQFGDLLSSNELEFSDVESIFSELSDYTHYHFQEEETMMAQIGIDRRHLDAHIEAHHNFLEEITVLYAGVSPDNINAAKHLLSMLTHWLAYHILGSDQNMARQIKAIRSGLSPSEAYDAEEQKRNDATEPLLAALNGLFQQVSARNKELIQLNQSLEATVTARTKALSEANRHLEELALTDVLTRLPNRRHAMRRLANLWDEALQEKTPLVCMMIDADHFKEVNDTYGHDAGDLVLCELAKTLQHAVRNDDIVCRLGGDEFFVICPNTDIKGGLHAAEVILQAVLALRVPTGDGAWYGSISIGVAVRTSDMKNYEELIKAADESIYIAKKDGKGCVRTIS